MLCPEKIESTAIPLMPGWRLAERDTMRQGRARWLTGLAIVTGMAISGLPAHAKQTNEPVKITSFSGAYLAARIAEIAQRPEMHLDPSRREGAPRHAMDEVSREQLGEEGDDVEAHDGS